MINFIICEDNKAFMIRIQNFVESYIQSVDTDCEIGIATDKSVEVLEYSRRHKAEKNIYIFDIELNDGCNGIQLAKNIRKYDSQGEIIFVTSHPTMVMSTFKYRVKAFDFIDKMDNIEERLAHDFDYILKSFKKENEKNKESSIKIQSGNTVHVIAFDEIIDFQMTGINHKIRLTTTEGFIDFYGRLKEIEKKLDGRFYKSHRACIINTDHVKRICKNG